MELIRDLMREQHDRGYLSSEVLTELAHRHGVPLYQVQGLATFYPAFRSEPAAAHMIRVCRDAVCRLAGAEDVFRHLAARADEDPDLEVTQVSCLGQCDSAPCLQGEHQNGHEQTLDTAALMAELLPPRDPGADPSFGSRPVIDRTSGASPELKNPPLISNPYESAADDYSTVRQQAQDVTTLPEYCFDQLERSGLRGMGGAGFPTGRKWRMVAEQSDPVRYVICNADESEPGTFKDRVLLEHYPQLVVEGMVLAGLAIGAERGIVYLRHEYTYALQSLENELKRARELGVLGERAAGTDRSFEIEIFVSPGGYILGEETALLEALEDRRGEPRNKPPYPAQHGLRGHPTLINNVETFAFATSIIHHGAKWWAEQGVGEHAGLKLVSVSGDVECPGVYEVPMGTTFRDILASAGGVADGRDVLAFLPGGASSNFLRPAALDLPLDFTAVQKAGSMLGTAAVFVIGEGRDLLDVATSLVRFFRNESCGKCVPCRLGTAQTVSVLEDFQAGQRSSNDLQPLDDLAETLRQTSICGLGQVALNPVVSLLDQFPEYRIDR